MMVRKNTLGEQLPNQRNSRFFAEQENLQNNHQVTKNQLFLEHRDFDIFEKKKDGVIK